MPGTSADCSPLTVGRPQPARPSERCPVIGADALSLRATPRRSLVTTGTGAVQAATARVPSPLDLLEYGDRLKQLQRLRSEALCQRSDDECGRSDLGFGLVDGANEGATMALTRALTRA